jgi:hypothetical protein
MQHPLVELDPNADVAFALEVASLTRTHHFPMFRRGALVGIVCTCDMDDAPRDQRIGELAHPDVVTIPMQADVGAAAQLMHDKLVGAVVALDGAIPCGILTREQLTCADPRWLDYFDAQHCEACGATKHLRPIAAGRLLCSSCASRARDQTWLETGGGD